MKLHLLPKIITKSKKRIGRGLGSGKGKTGGKGQKGQKVRGKIAVSFIGGGLPLYKKLPFRRGLKNPKISPKPAVITLNDLNKFKAKSTVNLESLIKEGLVSEEQAKKGVKVLAVGQLNIALKIQLPVSKKAKSIIEKKGGSVL